MCRSCRSYRVVIAFLIETLYRSLYLYDCVSLRFTIVFVKVYDCVPYIPFYVSVNLEDFSKPKIMWKIIGSRLAFAIDNNGIMLNNACYLLTGANLSYILGFLNSSPLIWYSEITNMNKTGVGDAQVGAQNIILFPVPPIIDEAVVEIVEQLLNNSANNNLKQLLSERIYTIYGLNRDERCYLDSLNL